MDSHSLFFILTLPEFWVGLSLLVLARSLPPFIIVMKQRGFRATDSWAHQAIIAAFATSGRNLFGPLPMLLMKSNAYPVLFHYLLSFFPLKMAIVLGRFLRVVTDSLLYFVTAIVLQFAFGIELMSRGNTLLWTAVFFIFTPIMTRRSTGITTLRSRYFGVVLGNCYFLCLYFYSLTSSLGLLIVAALLFGALILGARFGTQAAVLLCLPWAAFHQDFWLALFPIVLVIGYLLLTPKSVGPYLLGHGRFLLNYWKTYELSPITKFNTFHIPKELTLEELQKASQRLVKNSYFWLLFGAPFTVPLLWEFFSESSTPDPVRYLFVWLFSGVFVGILTSMWKFRVVGEGIRYLEYAIVPYMALATWYVQVHPLPSLVLFLLLAFCVVVSLANQRSSYRLNTCEGKEVSRREEEYSELQRELPDNARILFCPVNDASHFLWCFPKNGYYSLSSLSHHDLTSDDMKDLYGEVGYPYLNSNIDRLLHVMRKYDFRYVISLRSQSNLCRAVESSAAFEKLKEGKQVVLYRWDPRSNNGEIHA